MKFVISIVLIALTIWIWVVLWRTSDKNLYLLRYIHSIIRNNTGDSMKNFILLLGGVLVAFSVVAFIGLLYLDFFMVEKTLSISYYGYAAIIAAIEGLLGLLFFLKVKSEKYEHYREMEKREQALNDPKENF